MSESTTARTMTVDVYTDGACKGNPGPGGFGAVFLIGEEVHHMSGRHAFTTNNRMEVLAAVEALDALPEGCSIRVFTDSKYLTNGITRWVKAWQRKDWRRAEGNPVLNVDLWKRLLAAVDRHDRVSWTWIKGHRGNRYNELADVLACSARDGVVIPFGKVVERRAGDGAYRMVLA